MAIRIMFDAANKPEEPTIVLARRNGDKIGAINAKEISISDSLNDAPELSFKVYKELDGEKCALWDEIINFKLIYCVEWNTWFEMTVELDENDETVKTVFCTGLGYAELGQIMLYTIEINTEEDIARDDYDEPTVLFNEKNPKASLLHRIMEKAPHYTVTHVDASIAGIQRTFSFDDTSIYDAFQDIAEEIKCIFILNANTDGEGKLQRTVEVYDLQSYCFDCGHRGDYFDICPECGSENVRPGYGEDTTIFITSDELADNIGFTTDTDAVKNCFKLEGGDDLMTATIRNCNPNGTDYLWYFSDDMKKDMPDDLVEKIESYDDIYKYYQNDYVVIPGYTDSLVAYNNLVDKYKAFNEDLERVEAPVKGYAALMNAYYNTIDLNLYLTSAMMPSVEMIETDAAKELAKLTTAALSPCAVQNVSVISNATADNVVLSMAKLIVDSRFKVKVNSSSIINSGSNCTWTGSFVVTNYYDDEDTATGNNIVVLINDDFEEFVKEKVEKQLAKEGDGEVDIVGLFKMTYDNFVNELRKYSLNRLRSFYASCQACLDVLIEQGVADKESWDGEDPNLYDDLYYPYLQKQNAISAEMSIREQEISIIVGERDADGDLTTYGLQNCLDVYKDEIQENLDFESYLGDELWLEFCAFRREDKYSNDNYISDALNNRELFDKAQEFLERATEEIHESAEQQHSITSDLKNLLIIDKFKPIVDKFSVGNWLRIMVNDTLYKLRLLNYEIDYDNIEDISVEFSDVIRTKDSASDIQSVLDQASDMATSYDSVKRQAEQGKNGNDKLNGWVNEGLSLTNMTIVGDADNQNMQWDSHGMLLREYLPITNTYDDRQLKIINRGLYVTDDNWTTSRAGIGNFRFYNPKTKEYEDAYGVIADTIVGNIVLSEEVGIYNKNNSITMDGDGFHITTSADALKNSDVFVIQKENKQPDGSVTLDKLLYFDNDGNLTINGSVNVHSSGSSAPSTDTTLGDIINATTDAIDKVDVEYALGDSFTIAPVTGWSTNSPVWTDGKYIWQRTATTTTSGKTSYSKPVCIQGAKGQDGIDGTNGTDGLPGKDGTSSYVHIKYAPVAEPTDSQMSETPDKYIGILVDSNVDDSTVADDYEWSKFEGEDGADGLPGANGEDGTSTYVHFAYSTTSDGSGNFSVTPFDGAAYIGVLTDENVDDSENYLDYAWSRMKGDDGTGVSNIIEQYAMNTNPNSAPQTGWNTEQPAWQSGYYIWTRSEIHWSDGEITHTTPVLAKAINGANENANWVRSYMTYDSTGLTIGAEGDPTSVRMSSSGEFQVRENGTVLARMSSDEIMIGGTSGSAVKMNSSGEFQVLRNNSVVASLGSSLTFYNNGVSKLNITSSGITVGSTSSSGYNAYIDPSGFHIRSGTTKVASYTDDVIDLGSNSTNSIVYLANRSIVLQGNNDYGSAFGSFSNVINGDIGASFSFGTGSIMGAYDSFPMLTSPHNNTTATYGYHGSRLGDELIGDNLLAAAVLYNNTSGTSGTVNLSNSHQSYLSNNIAVIDIQYTDGSRHWTKRVYDPWGKRVSLSYMNYSGGSSDAMWMGSAIVEINTVGSTGEIEFVSGNRGGGTCSSSGVNFSDNTSVVRITKVVGYR